MKNALMRLALPAVILVADTSAAEETAPPPTP